jgi:hypothetical protein
MLRYKNEKYWADLSFDGKWRDRHRGKKCIKVLGKESKIYVWDVVWMRPIR